MVKIHTRSGICAALAALTGLLAACNGASHPAIERLSEARTAAGQRIELPHEWSVGEFGEGQRIDVPFAIAEVEGPLGVFLGQTSLTFRASVNGRFVFESGGPDSPAIGLSSYRARPHFRVPAALLQQGGNTLTLELFAPANTRYRLLGWIYIGEDGVAERAVLHRLLAFQVGPLTIGIMLLAVGLVSLGLWRGRRDADLYLLLAGGSLLWALQILMYQWPERPLPGPHWGVFVTASYAWFPALIGVFFLRFAFRRSRGLEAAALALAALAAPLLYAGVHFGFESQASIALRAGVLLFITLALIALLRYALQLRTWTGYTLFTMGSVCVIVAVRDFLISLQPDAHDVLVLNPYSGVALLLFAGWMLLERHHKAYADFEMLNRDLERRVADANVELHRRLEQVEAARASAEQANVAKSRFFAAASHDLRQPLHSLGLFAAALRDVVGNAEGRDLVRRIGDAIGALNRLFDELLDISRLEAGTVEVRRRNVALQPLFDRLDDEFHADAAAKGIRLRFHPTTLAAHTDPTLLERIVANLVSNAVRYTRSGGVLVGARRQRGRVLLQVWDSGIGIAAEQRALIFEEFYQAGNPARDPKRGLGLGLAIVRRLATLLALPLDFRSEAGHGTCFELTLPRATGPVEPLPEEEVPAADQPFAGRRVLIIDDDPAICAATAGLLARWGCEARAATGYAQAVRIVDDGFAPHLVLADLRLAEDVDGIRAIERLRERLQQPVPALLISGDTGARELARVKDSGLLLLTKPVSPARLRSVLHAVFGEVSR